MSEEPMDDMVENPEEEAAPQEAGNNRVFFVGVGILALVLVLGLIGIGLFAAVILPGQRAAHATEAAAQNAANALVHETETQLAMVPTNTPVPPTATPSSTPIATATPVPPTETPVVASTATFTPAPSDTPDSSGTLPGGGTITATTVAEVTVTAERTTPTKVSTGAGGVITTTVAVTVTKLSGGGSVTPTRLPSRTPTPGASPTGLPNTGFADDVGTFNLLIMGLAFVAIVIIARRLRYSLR